MDESQGDQTEAWVEALTNEILDETSGIQQSRVEPENEEIQNFEQAIYNADEEEPGISAINENEPIDQAIPPSASQHIIGQTLDSIPEQSMSTYSELPAYENIEITSTDFRSFGNFDENQIPTPQSEEFIQESSQIVSEEPLNGMPIYSTVNKNMKLDTDMVYPALDPGQDDAYANLTPDRQYIQPPTYDMSQAMSSAPFNQDITQDMGLISQSGQSLGRTEENQANIETLDVEIGKILTRHKQGAVESGSFKNNFKKKLPSSASSTDNDLSAHRQKLLESQEVSSTTADEGSIGVNHHMNRNQSVSFNVNSSRSGSRVSVDIRNLPSYLTNKRASIVDVAKGAVSSLFHRRRVSSTRSPSPESSSDDEPIFEEPIAPTLSLGQRVAWVSNEGPEFGTVGWIGQLPDIDDDWIVGVIFDNMIGNCDGEYLGVRYFYARENYAMFLPLSALTKTDNYIGRPETGTMLSRMSVSLKPGQLISIQRSSIRLQHCFLNAPHQRVGHDVRAVSNRLHCQCHTCGPCAHLTKQGQRMTALPHFGAHHLHHERKKNSLAQAAIELFAHHHHHHFHEEDEPHENEDHRFGENSAHACNFVRYSCCQQSGIGNHDFLADCEMVRPELLDNLIHAPRAPHRRSRIKKVKKSKRSKDTIEAIEKQKNQNEGDEEEAGELPSKSPLLDAELNNDEREGTMISWQSDLSDAFVKPDVDGEVEHRETEHSDGSSYSGGSSRSSSRARDENIHEHEHEHVQQQQQQAATNGQGEQRRIGSSMHYRSELTNYRQDNNKYNTIDSHISLMDQRRFIQQRDSSAFLHSHVSFPSEDNISVRSGFGSSIRRCLRCLFFSGRRRDDRGAGSEGSRRQPRLSARNRLIEYRRKQSTFVPSTLAKPQDDFASHGLVLPGYEESYNFGTITTYEPDEYLSDRSSRSCSSAGSQHSDMVNIEHVRQQQQQQLQAI